MLKQTRKTVHTALPEEEYKYRLRNISQKQPFSRCLASSSEVSQPVPSQDHILKSHCTEGNARKLKELLHSLEKRMTETVLRSSMVIPTYHLAHHAYGPERHPQRSGCTLQSQPGADVQSAQGPPHPPVSSLTHPDYHVQQPPTVSQEAASREDWASSWASQHWVHVQASVSLLGDGGYHLRGLRLSLQGRLANVNSLYHQLQHSDHILLLFEELTACVTKRSHGSCINTFI